MGKYYSGLRKPLDVAEDLGDDIAGELADLEAGIAADLEAGDDLTWQEEAFSIGPERFDTVPLKVGAGGYVSLSHSFASPGELRGDEGPHGESMRDKRARRSRSSRAPGAGRASRASR